MSAGAPRSVDILMITYNSADYVSLSLPRLLASCDEHARVWLWHNGDDEATLEAVRAHAGDPRVHRFHHSRENVRLRTPTNWLWAEGDADFVSKVDDDCLVQPDWLELLRRPYADFAGFGVLGSWRFPDEDFVPELAGRKIAEFPGGHRVLRNHWVQGSGYLLPRRLVAEQGPLREGQSFTQYCLALARRGAVNGWSYPFVREDHMDDPRSAHTLFRTDADFARRRPLSAQALGVTRLADWEEQMRDSARTAQTASLDLREYSPWRARRRALARRVRRSLGGRARW
ncbi:glycosyltransferase family 2 protein [Motilibacter deserti]|uniref:Glycosyltransferase family 2 protein n=1 Tax=Motilibacter deserti TaxID=2714956 RepID=A0ABX0GU42_9ACTN|nr:glycosyltransferase family A protein [Motilibacter deserti]NHC14419.1 glycosyltransferase family 2 protein [Motilibacter deserti]